MSDRLTIYARNHADFPPECETMKLRLVYSGPLPSRAKDPAEGQYDRLAGPIHEIRRQLHPQLKRFWAENRYLRSTKAPTAASHMSPSEHSYRWDDGPADDAPFLAEHVADNFRENGYRFVPLVCEEWSLSCALHILFLRRDPPGAVLSHGDLDNRLKSLIDGLRKPQGANEIRAHPTPGEGEDPFYVLLQDDKLITDLEVETGVLLTPPLNDRPANDCHVVLTAEIKPYDVSIFNLGFY